MERLGARLADILIALATALTIIAVIMPLFLNPVWVGFEQGRAEAAAWTGFSEADLRSATDAILADLVVGPPDFDVVVAGAPVLNEREQSHMRDVRGVFIGFFALAIGLLAAAVVVVLRRGQDGRAASWRAVRTGALGLIVGLVLVGGFAVIAFDLLFEVFHQVFFAGGELHVRSGHGAARAALPVPVLAGDGPRPSGSWRSSWPLSSPRSRSAAWIA